MELLKQLIQIVSPPGDELPMRDFLIDYVKSNEILYKTKPIIISGEDFQNCLILVFGKPEVAIFAHMDTVAYMAGYDNGLLEMGSPDGNTGADLVGLDEEGFISCKLVSEDQKRPEYQFHRKIDSGTQLTYAPYFLQNDQTITATYLDDRIGIYNALKVAETLENGIIVFSCWEEHGGGSVGFLTKYIYEKYGIRKALISDITWASEGIIQGNGVVISLRDAGIPRRSFVKNIISRAKEHHIKYQIEVEEHGSSDGGEIQKAPYPIDWCFIGPPSTGMHTEREMICKNDLDAMLEIYSLLMKTL